MPYHLLQIDRQHRRCRNGCRPASVHRQPYISASTTTPTPAPAASRTLARQKPTIPLFFFFQMGPTFRQLDSDPDSHERLARRLVPQIGDSFMLWTPQHGSQQMRADSTTPGQTPADADPSSCEPSFRRADCTFSSTTAHVLYLGVEERLVEIDNGYCISPALHRLSQLKRGTVV